MELNSKTKFINFKEFYHGEAYVTITENKPNEFIFSKFLEWIKRYSNPFYSFLFFNREIQDNIKNDFKNFLLQEKRSKYFEYKFKDEDLNIFIHFHKEDNEELIVKNPNGALTDSITCDITVEIPSLHDGNILHEDQANKLFSMIITNSESIKVLKDN